MYFLRVNIFFRFYLTGFVISVTRPSIRLSSRRTRKSIFDSFDKNDNRETLNYLDINY